MKVESGLMIRIGLGLFFLAFGIIKLIGAQFFVEGPYQMFYGVGFPVVLVYLVGIIQIAIAVAFFANKYTKIAGWIATVFLAATIIATFPKIVSGFVIPPPDSPPGFLFFAAIPVLFMALSEALKE